MGSTENRCARCRDPVDDDDPRVWLRIESANLGYDPLDTTHLLCDDCYEAYLGFIGNGA